MCLKTVYAWILTEFGHKGTPFTRCCAQSQPCMPSVCDYMDWKNVVSTIILEHFLLLSVELNMLEIALIVPVDKNQSQ